MKTKLAILALVIFTAALLVVAAPALAAPTMPTGGSCNSPLCQPGGAASPCCLVSANPLYDCILGTSPAGTVSPSSRPATNVKPTACPVTGIACPASQDQPVFCVPATVTGPPAPAGALARCRNCLSSEDPLSLP